jgi:Leucine-rich repeat (LRR) protein
MQTCVRKGLVVHTTELSQPWADFAQLMVLDLSNHQLTDADFVHLSQLKNLRVLNLSDTNISDQNSKHLHRLKSVTAIYLQQTKLSARALTRLRDELPRCAVIA